MDKTAAFDPTTLLLMLARRQLRARELPYYPLRRDAIYQHRAGGAGGAALSFSRGSAAYGALDLGVLEQDEGVGHAGDVVGDGAGETFGLDLFEVAGREFLGIFDPEVEERGDDLFGFVVLVLECVAGVEGVVEVAFFLEALGLGLGGKDGEASGMIADVLEALRSDDASVLQ